MKNKIDINFDDLELQIDLSEWLDDIGIPHRKNGTGQLILQKCFNCGSKEKLYIDAKNGVYNCFKCGPSAPKVGKGNLFHLAKHLGKMNLEQTLKYFYHVSFENEKATMQSLLDDESDLFKKKKLKFQMIIDPIELPKEFEKLDKQKHIEAWNYLVGRGIKESTIEKLGAYYADSGLYAKRVININYIDDKPVGFVARDITKKSEKKVLNSPGKFRSYSIWNMAQANESKELILCEGIFSAVQCGIHRSVALLGKTASEHQLDLIRQSKAEKIYICLDVGTDTEQENLYNSLVLYFPKKIYQIILPDILDLKKYELSETLKQKIESEFKIKFSYHENYKNKLRISYNVKDSLKKAFKLKSIILKNKFSPEEFEILEFFATKAEYLDSGDYSEEQMDALIKAAPLFKKKTLLSF